MSRNIIEGKSSKGEVAYYHGIEKIASDKRKLKVGDKITLSDGKKEEIKNRRLLIPHGNGFVDAPIGMNEDSCFIVIESLITGGV